MPTAGAFTASHPVFIFAGEQNYRRTAPCLVACLCIDVTVCRDGSSTSVPNAGVSTASHPNRRTVPCLAAWSCVDAIVRRTAVLVDLLSFESIEIPRMEHLGKGRVRVGVTSLQSNPFCIFLGSAPMMCGNRAADFLKQSVVTEYENTRLAI